MIPGFLPIYQALALFILGIVIYNTYTNGFNFWEWLFAVALNGFIWGMSYWAWKQRG